MLQSHWYLLLLDNKPKNFDFIHQTVSRQEVVVNETKFTLQT